MEESKLKPQKNSRTIEEINEKIRKGDAQVLTAEEMKKLVESSGVEVAFKEVDVVTTGTFGAMCSSGAIINLGHSDPPIKIQRAWINDVEMCHPGAAVDLYIGATAPSETQMFEYGGGHVIEDLVRGKEVELRATAYGTDCYPRTQLKTNLTKDDLNQFYLAKLPQLLPTLQLRSKRSRRNHLHLHGQTACPDYETPLIQEQAN